MTTFVVAHGAWSSGWAWKKMRPLLRELGHELFTPSHTGLGERAHLAHAGINLDSHIADILNVLQFEDLSHVVLIGHSYGGMVATGVADRAPDRIGQLIYLDAFVPRHGQSLLDLIPPEGARLTRDAARLQGEGWRVPPSQMPPDTHESDVTWAKPKRLPQPLQTFEQPVALTGAVDQLRRSYIYCTRPGPGDVFRQFADMAKATPGWSYRELDASHNPHITTPSKLGDVLIELLPT